MLTESSIMFSIPSVILFVQFASSIKDSIYLYNTKDSLSIQTYDCLYYETLFYCLRPLYPIKLERDYKPWHCYEGKRHSFFSLWKENISVHEILHNWKSSLDQVEEYIYYLKYKDKSNETEEYLCECTNKQSFGKYCEYLLPLGNVFETVVSAKFNKNSEKLMYIGDIVCYKTLICDFGMLCLDWRDICDGNQQCMYGYDEENCDLLEFNECESDEYRCMNGMCIPDEFFLDGDFDCMDMSDEKDLFNETNCAFQSANYLCDDRICHPNQWSCGDGQCILDRMPFHSSTRGLPDCMNRRDQFFWCETAYEEDLWTLQNGRCSKNKTFDEQNIDDYCHYLKICQISFGLKQDCSCQRNKSQCIELFVSICSAWNVSYYPKRGLIAPYIFGYYVMPFGLTHTAQSWRINGTIKCRGDLKHFDKLPWSFDFSHGLQLAEGFVCSAGIPLRNLSNKGYDPFCHNDSRTFNNRSYNFIDVCVYSKRCLSTYRIHDGISNCFFKRDEEQSNELITQSCSNVQRHRFRCSSEQVTCFYANELGNSITSCKNNYDEFFMGTQMALSRMICNSQSKVDCQFIRQYIETSWNLTIHNNTQTKDFSNKTLPFRSWCDTFEDNSRISDENRIFCQLWICSEEQVQCHSGHCIDLNWIFDGEWDCPDGSDEENFFAWNISLSNHNSRLFKNISNLKENFYKNYPKNSLWNICNSTDQFQCLPNDISLSSHLNEHCINLPSEKIIQMNCFNRCDEKNILDHCYQLLTKLEYYSPCLSMKSCLTISRGYISTLTISPYTESFCKLCYATNQCSHIHPPNFQCWNGTCTEGRCDGILNCLYGEDEYMCTFRVVSQFKRPYREEKKVEIQMRRKTIELLQYPFVSVRLENLTKNQTNDSEEIPLNTILNQCNRGIPIKLFNNSFICFCPPQYHGDQCQYHTDRLTLNIHINFTYSNSTKNITNKYLILLLYYHLVIDIKEFHLRPIDEINKITKKMIYFDYSRSKEFILKKQNRYFNRLNIITEHPYTIRIEAYELLNNEKARRYAVWKYFIYFDYLSVYRLAKVIRFLNRNENISNPCLINQPCNSNQECYQIENNPSEYICLCKSNYSGLNCTNINQLCHQNYCSSTALCQPDSQSLISGYSWPYCICPLNYFGQRCHLILDVCSTNPCHHNGTCYSQSKPNEYNCQCIEGFYGKNCQDSEQSIYLNVKKNTNITYQALVIQYFQIDFIDLDLILINQNIYSILPSYFHYIHKNGIIPELILLKIYFLNHFQIYLLTIQINQTFIRTNISFEEYNQCKHVHSLFSNNENYYLSKYHSRCQKNLHLLCFYDENYFCICNNKHTRVECFIYNHYYDKCSQCLANGRCLNDINNKFLCICPSCYQGQFCQFDNRQMSFTIDSLIVQENRNVHMIYLIISLLLFLVGGWTNYGSFITFKRPTPRKFNVGYYLLIVSIFNQFSLLSLLCKVIDIYFNSILRIISCKAISFILSISIRYTYWLTSWIALDRLCLVLFPFSKRLKIPKLALGISLITLIIVSIMHCHELIFYTIIQDPSGYVMCVGNFSSIFLSYNFGNVLFHHLIPFFIQIISITFLVFLSTRSRVRSKHNYDKFFIHLKQQFNSQKELYITPLIIIFSSLPQIIISLTFSCTEMFFWQRRLLYAAYLFSYTPQLLGFVLFVLPSTTYSKEF
ncbi:hypothetical protein I4U23_011097 [Adineta vaga]|nr:hypothetical protein I4U23_011097 [Adineta vaga]